VFRQGSVVGVIGDSDETRIRGKGVRVIIKLYTQLLKAKHLPQEIVMDLGEVEKQILATTSCALFMEVLSIMRILQIVVKIRI
jgi:hypothetical protein